MKLNILASGSEGNCVFISNGTSRILVDCGISFKEISDRLAAIGEDVCDIDAVLITHEHIDHIRGLDRLIRAVRPCVLATAETHAKLPAGRDRIDVEPGGVVERGGYKFWPVAIPHDAANPVAYTIGARDKSGFKLATIATDLGDVPYQLLQNASDTDFFLLEANHDPDMLMAGKYDTAMKIRVCGTHLTNDKAFSAVNAIQCRQFVLGHVSGNNNNLELLTETSLGLRGKHVSIAQPGKQGPVYTF